MSEYIKREDAMNALLDTKIMVVGMRAGKTVLSEYANQCRSQYINTLTNVPEVEVEPVKHGRWVTIGYSDSGSIIRQCSHCGIKRKGISKSTYCRDCGARMDLPELDGQMSYIKEGIT